MRHIVFAHGHIAPANFRASERGEAHIVFRSICSYGDDLWRGMSRGGILQLVLNGFEKILGDLTFAVIVYRESENLLNLLINPFLASTNVTDTLQQLVEVIRAKFPRIA